jgi:hypothetical protein
VEPGDRNLTMVNNIDDAVPFTTFSDTSVLFSDMPFESPLAGLVGTGPPRATQPASENSGNLVTRTGPRFADREYPLTNGNALWSLSSTVITAASGTVVTDANRCPGNVLTLDGRATPNSLQRGESATFELRALSNSTNNGSGAVGIVFEIPLGVLEGPETNTSVSNPDGFAAQTTTTRKGAVAPATTPTTTTTTPVVPKGVPSNWTCSLSGRFGACVNPDALNQRPASTFATIKVQIPGDSQASFQLRGGIVRDLGANETADALLRRFTSSGRADTDEAIAARFANTIGGATVGVTITGFTVNAGPDQPRTSAGPFPISVVPNADRSGTLPAVVTLDGTQTTNDGRDQTFVWTRTAGPAVTWRTPNPGDATKGIGRSAQFNVPTIRARTVFTFRLDVTANGSAGSTTKSDTVTVTLDPPPNQPPIISGLTASPSSMPVRPGNIFNLTATASDPDSDALSFSWKVVTPALSAADGARVLIPGTNGRTARAQWPTDLPIPDVVTAQLTVTDARGETTVRTVDIGRPAEALSVAINTADGVQSAQPGQQVQFIAVPSSVESGLEFAWRQTSGAPIALPSNTTTRTISATIPSGNPAPITLEVSLRLGARSATATKTLNVRPSSALSVDLDSPPIVAYGAVTTITPTISGGFGPYATSWTTEAGQVLSPSTSSATGAITFTAPTLATSTTPVPIPAILRVTVRDAGGQEVSARIIVVYGPSLEPPSLSLPEICGRGILGRIITDRVGTFGLGSFATINLGTVTLPGSCSAETQINFTNASASFFNGSLVGAGLTGRVNASAICLTAGQLNADPAFGLPAADISLDAPICVNVSALTGTTTGADSAIAGSPACLLSGRLTYNKLPFLEVPEVFSLTQSSLSFACGKLQVEATGTIAGGTFDLSVTVTNGGNFDGAVSVNNLTVFGQQLNLNGRITKAGPTVAYSVTGGIDTPNFGVSGITVPRLDVTWDKRGLHGSATGSITPNGADPVAIALRGDFVSSANWTLTASATTGDWQIAQGLTLGKGSLVGSLSRSSDRTTFDVTLDASGTWALLAPDTLVLRAIKARISNTAPDSALCPGLQPNETFVSLSGDGTIRPPGGSASTPIELATSGCIGLASGSFRLKLNAKLNSWRPVADVDATIESLAFVVQRNGAGQYSIEGQGSMRARGAVLGARIVFLPGGGLVIDGGGDVSALGIPFVDSGHVIFATQAQSNYQVKIPVNGQFVDEPDFAPFNLPAGLTLAGKFSLEPSQQDFLRVRLGLDVSGSLVVLASLTGASVELKVQLNLGDGIDLFRICPALTGSQDPKLVCTDANTTTSLTLTTGYLALSSDGSFGIGAEAKLHLPSSEPGQPPSDLDLGAQLTINVLPPVSIQLALYKTGGDWNNALGIRGLTLGDLAIQGGIVFNPPPAPPTPTIAFLAEIRRLPDATDKAAGGIDLSTPLGIVNSVEGMRFAFQISQKAPIFEMTLGKQDGRIFMRPLSLVDGIEGKVARAFEVDYATLVIAPLGGKIGPITYEPGFTMGFAANVLGTPIDMKVRLGLIPPELEAHAAVGRVVINGITLDGAVFDMKATSVPPTFHLEIQGSVDLGEPTMEARVLTDLDPTAGKLMFAFDGRLSNWQLNPATRLNNLSIIGKAELTSFASPPTVTLSANANGVVLGSPMSFAGSVGFSGTTLQSLDLRGAPGTFSYLGTSLRGYRNSNGICADLVGVAANSPCFRLRWGAAVPFAMTVQAGITSGPANVELEGSIDENGIGGSGELRVDGVTSAPVVVTASLWTRPLAASALPAARRPKVPRKLNDGTYVFDERNVVDGDWYVGATINESPLTIAGLPIAASLSAGKVSGTTFAAGQASSAFRYTLPNATQPLVTSDVLVRGVIAKVGSGVTFDLLGAGAIRIDGHELASAKLHLTEQGAAVDGRMVINGSTPQTPLASVEMSGAICAGACPNLIANTAGASATALNYRLTGSSALNIADLGMRGEFELIRIPNRSAFVLNGSVDSQLWRVSTTGNLQVNSAGVSSVCLTGTATLKLSAPVSGQASFCSDPFSLALNLNAGNGVRVIGSVNGNSGLTLEAQFRVDAPGLAQDNFGTCLFDIGVRRTPSSFVRCREFGIVSGRINVTPNGPLSFVPSVTLSVRTGSAGKDASDRLIATEYNYPGQAVATYDASAKTITVTFPGTVIPSLSVPSFL